MQALRYGPEFHTWCRPNHEKESQFHILLWANSEKNPITKSRKVTRIYLSNFLFFRVKINPSIGWLTCHISCQVLRSGGKSEWAGDERGKSKGGRRKWGGWEKRKWEGVRGEGETEHWRYKFDSSIYFRKDWKRSVILKVGTQLATTNQAYQVYWLTQQQFWS